ncbi:MAG: hypothetical protein IPG60_04845 [Bacteroidetes bacterium]|nr:hypothetical protein [Bacteroidota bacterium]MBP7400546.1 hypothetical protein [Chitinophagales bacterium]MBK7109038.1 hypothetical protein [Bacteroidota bacterium]MBK8488641.1 hypothetical protein [Bacteroidota bacterium]MBK8681598.1 hypothetical protein [Bacteroidota bacterium]
MKKIILVVFASFTTTFSFSQFGINNAGARTNALGDAGTSLIDGFSAANNQGAMAFVENITLAVSAISYYQFEDLTSAWIAFTLPTENAGTFGFTFNFRGDETFQYNKAGIAYGLQLFDQFGIGIQLNGLHTVITQTDDGWAATGEVGLYYTPIKEFAASFRIFNAAQTKIGGGIPDDQLPTFVNFGIAYIPSDVFGIYLDGELNTSESFRIKTGLEYLVADILYLRGGFMSNPAQYTVGFGLMFDNFFLDASTQYHPQLGMSPSAAFLYEFE